jgi:ATP-binding cassette subfamily B protein
MRRLLRLVPYLRRHRAAIAAGIASILAAAALGLASPWILGRAVDALRSAGETGGRPLRGDLVRYAALLVGLTAAQGLFNFLQRRTLVAVSRDVEADLRNDFFAHLERLEPEFFHRTPIGDLLARSASDIGAVRMVCGPAIMYATHTVATAAGALVGMFWIDPRLSLVALASLPLVAAATRLFADRIHRLYERVQAELARLSAGAQENLSGVRVVRAFAQEAAEERRFAARNDAYVASNLRLARWQTAFFPALQMLVGLGFAAVLGFGGARVLSGALTLGELVTFHFFLAKLVWPMIAAGWVVNLVQRGVASLGRVVEVLDARPAIVDLAADGKREDAAAPGPGAVRGALELRGLAFRYRPELPPALEGIDVEIPAGARVGIVGRTGSGKSTLLALVPRLLDPPPGTVRLDGRDVREWPLSGLRRSVAMVPQESFLFSASIADNIAVGRPEATRAEIGRAAASAGLEEDLAGLPEGLDTRVGERGVTLSGGQKQRVALARALLRDAPILLLDDALSAVDARTERRILEHLGRERGRRTMLVVAHRVSTVVDSDLVLVLDRGRLVEQGRPQDLLARDGPFAGLARLQRLEDELEAGELVAPSGAERPRSGSE